MLRKIVIPLLLAGLAYKVYKCVTEEPQIPYLEPNPWWGPGEPQPEDTSIKEFKINIPKEDVEDFRARLALPLRLTPPLQGVNFTYGMTHDTLERIVSYWRTSYDWKKREPRLNTYNHFKTRIEGLDIHFMRASAQPGKNTNVKVVPLMLIHGWPGSVVEFFSILPLLTTPQKESNVVFEVICPSIPGYGFSQASHKQGLGQLEASQIFLKLMKRLGYEKFYLQGGDFGAIISTAMATMYPSNILGIHLNFVIAGTTGAFMKILLGAVLPAGIIVSEEDQKKLYPLGEKVALLVKETGYSHLQSTKPDTIGASLNDSPVGLASYILEKFVAGTRYPNIHLPDGGLLQKDYPLSLDEMLDNICLYWFTNTMTSAMRLYAEEMGQKVSNHHVDNVPCLVPAGLSPFPEEVIALPKNLAAHKFHDIVTYRDQPYGGHFAAMECPSLLASDIHKFVTLVEKRNQS